MAKLALRSDIFPTKFLEDRKVGSFLSLLLIIVSLTHKVLTYVLNMLVSRAFHPREHRPSKADAPWRAGMVT